MSNTATDKICETARNLPDGQFRDSAALAEKQLAEAREVGNAEHVRNLTTVIIGLNHAADKKWIDPKAYTEAVEDRIDAGMDAGLSYVEAVYAATH